MPRLRLNKEKFKELYEYVTDYDFDENIKFNEADVAEYLDLAKNKKIKEWASKHPEMVMIANLLISKGFFNNDFTLFKVNCDVEKLRRFFIGFGNLDDFDCTRNVDDDIKMFGGEALFSDLLVRVYYSLAYLTVGVHNAIKDNPRQKNNDETVTEYLLNNLGKSNG